MSDTVTTPVPKSESKTKAIDPAEHIKFLVTCIKYSTNGKVCSSHFLLSVHVANLARLITRPSLTRLASCPRLPRKFIRHYSR